MKTCRKCCEPKEEDKFGNSKKSKDGKKNVCLACCSRYQVEWQRKHPGSYSIYHKRFRLKNLERERIRDTAKARQNRAENPEKYRLINHRSKCKKYGVTVEWFEAKLAEQNGVCAICEQPCKSGRRLAIDHCHVGKAARGLLCADCNGALARLEAVDGWVVKALAYLRKYGSLI